MESNCENPFEYVFCIKFLIQFFGQTVCIFRVVYSSDVFLCSFHSILSSALSLSVSLSLTLATIPSSSFSMSAWRAPTWLPFVGRHCHCTPPHRATMHGPVFTRLRLYIYLCTILEPLGCGINFMLHIWACQKKAHYMC